MTTNRNWKSALLITSFVLIFSTDFSFASDKDKLMDMSLEELLDIKVNTAAKYEQTLFEAPASVSVVTSEDIEMYGYKNLQEILMGQRGFFTNNDRNYVYMGLRGFNRPASYNSQIVLLLNGMEVNEKFYGSPFFGYDFPINPKTIDRIEIVRGPGSVLYGSGATFAVINIITKTGKQIDGLNISGELGSFGKRQTSVLIGKELGKDFSYTLSGEIGDLKGEDINFEKFVNDSNYRGIVKGLDWEKYRGLTATASYKDLSLQVLYSSREKGVPTASWLTVFDSPLEKTIDIRTSAELKYTFKPFSSASVNVLASFNRYNCGGAYPYHDTTRINPDSTRANPDYLQLDSTFAEWYEAEAQFIWDIFPQNRLTAGGEFHYCPYADYTLWDDKGTIVNIHHPFNLASFYLQDQFQILENLSVTGGLRLDHTTLIDSLFLTPRVSLIYNPFENSAIKLLFGESFRSPNVYEMYYEDSTAAISNPDLIPERLRELELIWEQKLSDNLFGTISSFIYNYKNLIDQTEVIPDSKYQFQNISSVDAAGLEFEIKAVFSEGVSGYLNYSYQYVKNKNNDSLLTNSPQNILKGGILASFLGIFHFAVECMYESERQTLHYQEDGKPIKTEPYFLANCNLLLKSNSGGSVFLDFFKYVNVGLQIRNIFNKEYFLPGGYEHIQDAIIQDGRAINLEVSLNF